MNARILIVDDNPANLKLAADVLGFDGYHVETVENAAGALEALRRQRPDLILMDIAMPGMDGLALTRLLKADPATQLIPVVALTASAMKGDERRTRAAGCDGYISKPIDTRTFSGQVADYVSRGAVARPDSLPPS
mgnify:CR=1 FL=1